jgi:hypothetical protein
MTGSGTEESQSTPQSFTFARSKEMNGVIVRRQSGQFSILHTLPSRFRKEGRGKEEGRKRGEGRPADR